MDCIMLSLEDIAAVKVAIDICNRPEIKQEILCTPGSDYDIHKRTNDYAKQTQWEKIVEKKATVMLENLGMAKQLQEKVLGLVLLVGMRMLTWAEYREGTLSISREYSVNFWNNSFFTQRGIIDNKKAAEELMKNESLNTKQKYKLACLYCFADRIPVLFKQMTKEDKKDFYDADCSRRIQQPELVKFWSYYLMREIDKLKGDKNIDQYRLEKAVECGCKAAVEYCLEEPNLRRQKHVIVDAAVEAVRGRNRVGPYHHQDCFFFRNVRCKVIEELWVPRDYYVDILSFLLSKMQEDQLIAFLKRDIENGKYKRKKFARPRALECFLDWPYQEYFMKMAELMWEFLPEGYYVALLLRMCDKIESKREHLKYGEERCFDYRELLRKFWLQSPEHYKRYVFSNQEMDCIMYGVFTTKAGLRLLIKLLTLQNFTYKDIKNIELIFASATDKEKENVISSQEWREVCIWQMENEKWEILDRFVLNSFHSKEEEDKFKKELFFTEKAKRICIWFVRNDKWNAAESFMTCSSLSEEDISKLKKDIIYSKEGMSACVDLISPDKKMEALDKFIRWCFPSEEKIRAFRKELVFAVNALAGKCVSFIQADELDLVSEFINFCLSSEEEVRESKKRLAYSFGDSVCEELILHSACEEVYDNRGNYIGKEVIFKGVKWEEVEQFLTWCFSSEEEMSDFKKNVLLEECGREIHFNLIKSNQWEEAETFFAWLGLSAEEIKKLKKDTLFHCDAASLMFCELMSSKEGDEEYVDYGSKQEAIELFLRWYLTDKETVLEFRDKFKSQFCGEVKALFENFDSAIAQRLSDLGDEEVRGKRKSVTSPPSKKFCNLKFDSMK